MPDISPSKPPTASPSLKNAAGGKKATKAGADEGTIKVASKKDGKAKMTGPSNIKKPLVRQTSFGNWRDANIVGGTTKKAKANAKPKSSRPASPVVNETEEASQETFETNRPPVDIPDLQQCRHCKKSVTASGSTGHIAGCLKLKKEKAQRKKEAREARERAKEQAAREEEARKAEEEGGGAEDSSDEEEEDKAGANGAGPGGKTTKKPAGKKTGAADDPKGKKRKAEGDPDGKAGPKTKKKKDEPKPKAAKPKGPVDVERQCGVITPSGQPCARSLTCKTHSMGAKRAVPGRSLPYDMLLAAYQKKNQAKQQKAALDANAPVQDEDDGAGPVDSDEETAAVMSALSRWRPQPVVPQPVFTPIRKQYQLARLHEQLMMATNGGRDNIFKVVGFGAQKLPEGHPGLMDSAPRFAPDPQTGLMDTEDAPGEEDAIMYGGIEQPRRSSSFGPAHAPSIPVPQGQRQPAVAAGRA